MGAGRSYELLLLLLRMGDGRDCGSGKPGLRHLSNQALKEAQAGLFHLVRPRLIIKTKNDNKIRLPQKMTLFDSFY